MRVLVTGGRDYIDEDRSLARALAELKPTLVIHGDQRGADTIARKWAENNNVVAKPCAAPFQYMGPWAGMMRNIYMLDNYRPDIVLAAPGGTGTENCIRNALLRGIPVRRTHA